MTEKELYSLLTSKFDTVVYDHLDKKVQPPFVLYRFDNVDVFMADNINFFNENRYSIYLVTDKKDTSLEKRMESLLREHEIVFEKAETYISSERIYEVEYSI